MQTRHDMKTMAHRTTTTHPRFAPRSRRLHVVCGIVIVLSTTARVMASGKEVTQAVLERGFQSKVAPFLKAYCLGCHGDKRQEAKLTLSSYRSAESVSNAHQTWEIVLERLEANEMPPEDAKRRPKSDQRRSVIEWIKQAREFDARRNAGDPGSVLVRRLSNAEYNYTIRDLTGVDIRPTKTFPVDPANESGFDNSGESLSMSPALLRKYLAAARRVTEHLVLKPDGIAFAPHPAVTDTDRDKYCVKRIVDFYARQPTDLAEYFEAAWRLRQAKSGGRPDESLESIAAKQGVSPKYLQTVWTLLEDPDEELAVGPILKLRSMWRSLPSGNLRDDEVKRGCVKIRDFVMGLRRKLKPKFPNITIEGSHVGSQPFVLWKNRQYVAHRRRCDRSVLVVASKTLDKKVDPDLVIPADEAERTRHLQAFERFCAVFPDAFYISERGRDYVKASQKQMGEKGRLLSAGFHSMMGYFRDDRPLYEMILDEAGRRELDGLWRELDFIASAPTRQYVGFLWFDRTDNRFMREPQFDFARPENKNALTEPLIKKLAKVYLEKAQRVNGGKTEIEAIRHYFKEINSQIRWVEKARQEAEPSHLHAVLEFAGRAHRRPLSKHETESLKQFYWARRNVDGLTHEESIQDTLVSVLMSPMVLYRVDLLGVGTGRRSLTDDELASRLSYFLWSSLPDAELLKVAAEGRLHRKDVLIQQTARMLKDHRVRGLATEFGGNWLDFRRFEEHNSVDRRRFPSFTDELRRSMFEEPIRFFVDVAQRDGSVLEFLNAKHTFVNPPLAKHYGMPVHAKAGSKWWRVDNADANGRGGVLPMSVFLTKNAPGLRTSPVKRGYWVVRRLLGERIPPPPPNVPELPEDESKLGDLTLRQTLAKHRENKSCAGCHNRFDSIGLAFESFGPIGEHRSTDLGGRPVNTAATFPGGHEGRGLKDLQDYLQQHRQDEYLESLCRKLLSYALGRSLVLSDELLIREMRAKLAADDNRFSSLVRTIVTSPQFLNKRGGDHLAR